MRGLDREPPDIDATPAAPDEGTREATAEPSEPASAANGTNPVRIDPSVAHAARIYDYLLGGTTNFEADRDAAAYANANLPGGLDAARANVRANRDFLTRAVAWLGTTAGVRQFLDIGTGVPNADNVHSIARKVAPDARIVCVDNDPIVLAHAHKLLIRDLGGAAAFVIGDLRHPADVLAHAATTLDLDEPVAVILVAVLHFIENTDEAYEIVEHLMASVAPGSYLALSHGAADIDADNMAELARKLSERSRENFVWRTRQQVAHFFDRLELVDPGVVLVDRWHPSADLPPAGARMVPFYGAVGRKPDPVGQVGQVGR